MTSSGRRCHGAGGGTYRILILNEKRRPENWICPHIPDAWLSADKQGQSFQLAAILCPSLLLFVAGGKVCTWWVGQVPTSCSTGSKQEGHYNHEHVERYRTQRRGRERESLEINLQELTAFASRTRCGLGSKYWRTSLVSN